MPSGDAAFQERNLEALLVHDGSVPEIAVLTEQLVLLLLEVLTQRVILVCADDQP